MTVHQSTNASPAIAAVPLPDSIPLVGKSAPAVRRVRPNQVLTIVCLAIALANLDLFIVNVALPDIARDFAGAGLDRLSWILNGYAIVYAALLVFFGRLAERYRRNLSFLVGVAVFTLASAACAAATSLEMLVAFRVAQAAGAALMTPTSLGLLLAAFPPEKRGHAVRTWAAVGGFAAALGPVVGGFLVTSSWRWISWSTCRSGSWRSSSDCGSFRTSPAIPSERRAPGAVFSSPSASAS